MRNGAADSGGDGVTTDSNERTVENPEEEDEKSLFGRGALFGLVGGAVAALLLITVGGSVISLADDMFGNGTSASAAEQLAADSGTTDQGDSDVGSGGEGDDGQAALIAKGEDVANANACVSCHTTDGSILVGPSWAGLASRVDDEYLRRAIVDPGADIAAGFTDGLMPIFYADTLMPEDIDALIAYIKSL